MPEIISTCVLCNTVTQPTHLNVLSNGRGSLAHVACVRAKLCPPEEFLAEIGKSLDRLIAKVEHPAVTQMNLLPVFASVGREFQELSRCRRSGISHATDALIESLHRLRTEVQSLVGCVGFGFLHEDVKATANRIKDMTREHLYHDLSRSAPASRSLPVLRERVETQLSA